MKPVPYRIKKKTRAGNTNTRVDLKLSFNTINPSKFCDIYRRLVEWIILPHLNYMNIIVFIYKGLKYLSSKEDNLKNNLSFYVKYFILIHFWSRKL